MKTWLTGLMMFAALTAAAQAEIVAGTVVDRNTNMPVPNANVTVTFASGAKPLQTKTDPAGRFRVETTQTPASVTALNRIFEPFSMNLDALAPSVLADLRIVLNTRLVMLEHYGPRSVCGAFQPYQPWDRYVLVPGACGVPMR